MPSGNDTPIGKRIEKLRKEKGVSQHEMALALFVNRVTVSQWEQGTRDIKSGDIVSVAKYLGVSCDYLLGNSETRNPEYAKIYEMTGLSDSAVEQLKINMKVDPPYSHESLREEFLEAFNALVCNDYFVECISYLAAYIFPDGEWDSLFSEELSAAFTKENFQRLFKDGYAYGAVTSLFSKMLTDVKEMSGKGD